MPRTAANPPIIPPIIAPMGGFRSPVSPISGVEEGGFTEGAGMLSCVVELEDELREKDFEVIGVGSISSSNLEIICQ